MIHVTPKGHNTTFGPPSGSEDTVAALAVRREVDEQLGIGATSLWKPTEEELACLLAGAGVALTFYGSGHPVVSVGVVYE